MVLHFARLYWAGDKLGEWDNFLMNHAPGIIDQNSCNKLDTILQGHMQENNVKGNISICKKHCSLVEKLSKLCQILSWHFCVITRYWWHLNKAGGCFASLVQTSLQKYQLQLSLIITNSVVRSTWWIIYKWNECVNGVLGHVSVL